MGIALLDSSAIVAYLYADDALHRDASTTIERAVRDGQSLAISAVSWAELLHGANVGHHEHEVVRGFVGEFGVRILPVDADVAEQAPALQGAYARTGRRGDRPHLRTPDALILATANVFPEIETIIAGDAKWAKVPGVDAQVKLLRAAETR